jgi:prepilin-type N-terminal cleavage/methylation domain-containing protein
MLAKARTSQSWTGATSALGDPLRLRRRIGGHAGRRLWPREDAGFTLVEVLVTMVILVVGLLSLLTMLDTSVKASMTTRAREGGTNLAREIIEDTRTVPYGQIVPTSIEGQLQAMNGLADASSSTSGWQIDRRGFVFTVTVKECAIDDSKDGLAKTHGSTFCEGQQEWKEGIAVDTEPEDLKRMTVAVSWTIQKHTSTVTQVSTLTAAGQAIGLITTKLVLTSPFESTTPVIGPEYAATKALTFLVTFPEGTSAVDWSLEGAKQEEITVSSKATSTTFSWTINEAAQKVYISDGTYQVSAQTVNSTGVIGPPISISVRLIRGTPTAPSKIVGGFNTVYVSGTATEVAELEWEANSERDVIGYRAYGPNKALICPESSETLSTATSCIDFNLLATKPSERAYSVAALYRNAAEEVKEGAAGEVTLKRAESTAPNPPTNLVLTKNADGSVTLKWTAPAGGAEVWFYRIYRGSTNYTSRYGETTETKFTDTDATTTHEYWVTAVGKHLTESSFLGPVTG